MDKEKSFLQKALEFINEPIEPTTDIINQAAVNTGSEALRNISAAATGVVKLPVALKNRANAMVTGVFPWFTREKVNNPRNTWTIDKRNHLARYYDNNGELQISSPVGTGLIKGDKSKTGDNKSPNGSFRLGAPENGESKDGGTMSFGTYFYRTNHNGGRSGVGLHGTGNPLFNGMNISHGCFRVDNRAIEKFHKIAPRQGRGTKIVVYEKQGGCLDLLLKFCN